MPIDNPGESAGDGSAEIPEIAEDLTSILGKAVERSFDPNRVVDFAARTKEGVRNVLETRTDIVTDPSAATFLAARHNSHVRSPDIARHAYALMSRQGSAFNHREFFDTLRGDVRKHGVFVYPYAEEFVRDRIEATYDDGSRRFLIVETFARINDPDSPRRATLSSCADAQFHVPRPGSPSQSVIALPRKRRGKRTPAWRKDQIYDEDLVEEMRSMPYATAVLEDIASDRDVHKLGLAASAMNRGIRHIVHELNPTRGAYPIRFVGAEIVSIQGFKMKGSGQVVRLQNDLQIAPILNDRSMAVFDHFNSVDCEAFQTAWIRRGSLVPVEHEHIEDIIVDWHVKVARLKKPE